ncbi:MAG: hypothetical protein J6B16_03025 [Clostridia bacterium]|nr:hypothetical protein [Clostridia bacterium]
MKTNETVADYTTTNLPDANASTTLPKKDNLNEPATNATCENLSTSAYNLSEPTAQASETSTTTSDVSVTPPKAIKQLPISGGIAQINLSTADYSFVFDAIDKNKTLIDRPIQFIYGAQDFRSYYGYNSRFNMCEHIEFELDGTTPYRYVDSFANIHYFFNKNENDENEEPEYIIKGSNQYISTLPPATIADNTAYLSFINSGDTNDNQINRHEPICWLVNDSQYKGFNIDGYLCVTLDLYGKFEFIYLDEKNRITKITSSNNGSLYFNYINSEYGILTKISSGNTTGEYDANGNEKRTYETYFHFGTNDIPIRINYSDTEHIRFTHGAGGINIVRIDTSNELFTTFSYSNGKLVNISNYSGANEIPLISYTNTLLSSYDIEYGTNSATITDHNGNKEYYEFDNDEKLTALYVEENNKVTSAKQYGKIDATPKLKRYEYVKIAKDCILNLTPKSSFTMSDNDSIIIKHYYDKNNLLTEKVKENIDYAYCNEENESFKVTAKACTTYTRGHVKDLTREVEEVTLTKQNQVLKTFKNIKQYLYTTDNKLQQVGYFTSGINTTPNDIDYEPPIVKMFTYDGYGYLVLERTFPAIYHNEAVIPDQTHGGYIKQLEYNGNGKILKEYHEGGKKYTSYSYKANTGLVSKVTYPNGVIKQFTYDNNGNIITIKYKKGSTVLKTYNLTYALGEIISVSDGVKTVNYTYDAKRRIKKISLSDTYFVEYNYEEYFATSPENVLEKYYKTTMKNFRGEEFIQEYNKSKTHLKEYYKANSNAEAVCTSEKLFDRFGNVTTIIDNVLDETENFTYNDNHQLISYRNSLLENYKYNKYGYLSKTNGDINTTYTYKDSGNHALQKFTAHDYETVYIIDDVHRLSSKYVQYRGTPSGFVLQDKVDYLKGSAYNSTNYFTNIISQISEVISYDSSTNTYNTSPIITHEYDDFNRPVKTIHKNTESYRITYDYLDRVVREDNLSFNKSYVFAYDNDNNLVSKKTYAYTTATIDDTTTPLETLTYTYTNGILTKINNQDVIYNIPHLPTNINGKQITWGKDTLISSYDGNTFTYDCLNRLRSINNKDIIYAPDGNIYDYGSLSFSYDKNGLYSLSNGQQYFYRIDGLGNIYEIVDRNGNTVVQYKYDSWGNHLVLDGNGNAITDQNHIGHKNPFRFKGLFYNKESNLYICNNGFYSPEIGFFIQPNTISSFNFQNIDGFNWYKFAHNSPISLSYGRAVSNGTITTDTFDLNNVFVKSISKKIHWESNWFVVTKPEFFKLSKEGFVIVSLGLSIYKGNLYFDEAETNSLYFSAGNIGVYAGINYKKGIGIEANASVLSIGYDGRFIGVQVDFLTAKFFFTYKNGELKIDPGFGLVDFGISINIVAIIDYLKGNG